MVTLILTILVSAIVVSIFLAAFGYFRPRTYDHVDYTTPIRPVTVSPAYTPRPFPPTREIVTETVVEEVDLVDDILPLVVLDAVEEVIEGDDVVLYGRGYADTVEEVYDLADDTGEFDVYDLDEDDELGY